MEGVEESLLGASALPMLAEDGKENVRLVSHTRPRLRNRRKPPRRRKPSSYRHASETAETAPPSSSAITVLRVKRRRSDQPTRQTIPNQDDSTNIMIDLPSTLRIQTSSLIQPPNKRRCHRPQHEEDEDTMLAHLMHKSTWIHRDATVSSDIGTARAGGTLEECRSAPPLADDDSPSDAASTRKQPSSEAVFRRVFPPESSPEDPAPSKSQGSPTEQPRKRRLVRVIDARLLPRDKDTQQQGSPSKKPKLALDLLGSQTLPTDQLWSPNPNLNDIKPQKRAHKSTSVVLDPLMRLIDASLQNALEGLDVNGQDHRVVSFPPLTSNTLGTASWSPVARHLHFLTTDERVLSSRVDRSLLINYSCPGTQSTILHAAALWNDVQGAQMAVDAGADPSKLDADGLTPWKVAVMAGHGEVAQVLAPGQPKSEGSDFVYDVYYLDDAGAPRSTPETSGNRSDSPQDEEINDDQEEVESREADGRRSSGTITESPPDDTGDNYSSRASSPVSHLEDGAREAPSPVRRLQDSGQDTHTDSHVKSDEDDPFWDDAVEIRNGFGYWNERGELVLETDLDQEDGVLMGGDNDEIIRRRIAKGEEDYDSNDEDYDGNDYPDEDGFDLEDEYLYSQNHGGGLDDDNLLIDDEEVIEYLNSFNDDDDDDDNKGLFQPALRMKKRLQNLNRNIPARADDDDDDLWCDMRHQRGTVRLDEIENGTAMAVKSHGLATGTMPMGFGVVRGANNDDDDDSDDGEYRGRMLGVENHSGNDASWGDVVVQSGNSTVAYDPDLDSD